MSTSVRFTSALVLGLLLLAASASARPLLPQTVPGQNGLLATSPGGGVYVVRPDGSSPRFVVSGASPSWSPDGRRLVVFRSRPGPCAPCLWELVLVDLQRGTETKVVEGSGFDPAPAWSPDGSRIAYSATPLGVNHIFSVNVDGSDVRQLTRQSDAFNPSWSPDGLRIAYNAFTSKGVHVFTVAADGSDVRQLTPTGATYNVRPDWSPDGAKIAFGSDAEGSWELWTMSADGSDRRRLTSGAPPTTCATTCFLHRISPSWSPDGGSIAYASDTPGEGVAIVSADGSGKRLVAGTVGTRAPRWQSGVSLSLKSSPVRLTTRVGRAATAALTVTNTGRRDATRVQVRIAMTGSRGRINAASSAGTCTVGPTIVCTSPRLPAGGSISLRLRVTPTVQGRLSLAASVTAVEADVNAADDLARLNVTARR